jgi:FtsH-binding integral membrane protein
MTIFHSLVVLVDIWALACLWYVLDTECLGLTKPMKTALVVVGVGLLGQLIESVTIIYAYRPHLNTYFGALKDVGIAIFFSIKAYAVFTNKNRRRNSDISLKRRLRDA